MMVVSIMQPYFFPYLGYFQLINNSDEFIFLDDVNFINKGWINRNRILINGQPNFFTVPLKSASQNRLIMDIEVNYDDKWQQKMLKSIEMNYKKAPFYSNFYPVINRVILSNKLPISELAISSIFEIFSYLGIEKKFDYSSNLDPKKMLTGQDRILFLCELKGATQYINPEGGNELYEANHFKERSIDLSFLRMTPISYRQLKTDKFIPYLSIIDLLMNVDPDSVKKEYLTKFEFLP